MKRTDSLPWIRRMLVPVLVMTVLLATAMPAAAKPPDSVIVLPGATGAEGIAVGAGSTFYAGDLFTGDIFRGNLRHGTVDPDPFIDAPSGRMAAGLKVDQRRGLLFVAGGATGEGYVYDVNSGTPVAVYQFSSTFINDVTVTREGAWFTDSGQAKLYFVPAHPTVTPGVFSTLTLTGPAANTSSAFNLNGIAATPNGATLIVAHSGTGKLYTVDPGTGASAEITGVSVPNVDGILLEAGRLWAVQNFSNQISEIRLSGDLTSGAVEQVITSPLFQVPTTVARSGNRLAVVNAKFDTGFPPTATQFEVVIVNR